MKFKNSVTRCNYPVNNYPVNSKGDRPWHFPSPYPDHGHLAASTADPVRQLIVMPPQK